MSIKFILNYSTQIDQAERYFLFIVYAEIRLMQLSMRIYSRVWYIPNTCGIIEL